MITPWEGELRAWDSVKAPVGCWICRRVPGGGASEVAPCTCPQGDRGLSRHRFQTVGQMVRVWRNECLRVFHDRLINETDKMLVSAGLWAHGGDRAAPCPTPWHAGQTLTGAGSR